MPKIAFSDVTLRSLKPPEQGQVDHWDKHFAGFGIRVSQGGSKTFVLKRDNRKITLGRYPLISLRDARDEAKRLAAEFTLGRLHPHSVSVKKAIEQYLDDKAKNRRARTVQDYRWLLNRHFMFTGHISDITTARVSRRLTNLPPSQYNHALTAGRIFFNWCRKRRYLINNPCDGLAPYTRQPRDRVLTDDEIRKLWKQEGRFADYVKLLLLTAQRRGELRQAVLKTDVFIIPASIAKNGREATIPLTSLAASLFKPFPIFAWAREKALLDKATGVKKWTLHDLRRTAATRMAELGVAPHVIERLLNHVTGQISGVAAVYNRARYLEEMRQALTFWENYLNSL